MYFTNPKLEKIFASTKLIIFDMNGLITNDEEIQFKAFNKILKKFNIKIDLNFWINKCVGYKETDSFVKIFTLSKIDKSPAEIKKIVIQQKNAYQKLVKPKINKIVRKGVLEIIRYIKNQTDKKLSLATSSTKQGYNITLGSKGLNIINNFEYIVCGEEVKKSKPDPEIYLKVKQHFKISANKCLAFEDSSPGVNAAKNAKMICWAVPNKYTKKQDLSRADFIISDLSKNAKIIS